MTVAATEARPPRPTHRRRRIVLALVVVVAAVLIGTAAFLASTRYLPAFDDARGLQAEIEQVATRIRAAGLQIDGPAIDGIRRDVTEARAELDRLGALLADDPLIAVARALPPTQRDVHGADALVAAARDVFDGVDHGLGVADRYVEIKAAHASAPGSESTLTRLVELMATTHDRASAAQAAFGRARATLVTVPDGPGRVLGDVRDAMADRIDTYGPMLDAYVAASDRLPAILGWDGPRRYLVLTQNPAELRPTGGYIGSFGIVTVDRGRLTERTFGDVALLDFPWDYPYIEPPTELATYLLGPDQPWQLADANWSPDFPTSAQDALRLYTNESGDDRIDGVVGITTDTIDELLHVTGPISVPEYDAVIASGETTLKTLQLTRIGRPGENRKAFLSTFSDHLFDGLLSLPSERWADLIGRVDTFRSQRLIMAWLKDPDEQRFVVDGAFDGAVRQDPGDFLYPVDSNVAPASKINAIASRGLRLDVALDADGNAQHTLDVTWDNPIETEIGRPYRELLTLGDLRNLGMYFRLLAPAGSSVESVSGGSFVELTAPAVVGTEANRSVFGSHLLIPPGRTELRYSWTSPRPVEVGSEAHRYRLTIQKQPGLRPGPLAVTIRVPEGFAIESATAPFQVTGDTARATLSFERDVEVDVRFASVAAPAR